MFTICETKIILDLLPQEFDSHDFIKMGSYVNTTVFLSLLKNYHGDFQKIDSQIGRFLMNKSKLRKLPIAKINEQESETIIGTKSICALWRKL